MTRKIVVEGIGTFFLMFTIGMVVLPPDSGALSADPDDPLRADFFTLVAVDTRGRRARYMGYATREEFAAAAVAEYGYGPTRTIYAHELHEGLPAWTTG